MLLLLRGGGSAPPALPIGGMFIEAKTARIDVSARSSAVYLSNATASVDASLRGGQAVLRANSASITLEVTIS